MKRYSPKDIEKKWQQKWDDDGTYEADLIADKPKYIAMSMFNYPSGAGIHIGHAMNYTISDVKARFKRQAGYESYHPVGWDAFGLPAENYAIKAGVSPQASMATIIPSYHKQYKAMGWSNDWSKEIATHEPKYYKWTQWIFSEMYRNGLAYQDARMQWWCDKCQTVLANEQIIDGKCWRHDGTDDQIVQQKEVKQWFFKITEYADELLEAIDDLDWTESVKLAQKNWIGKSKGAEIDFVIEASDMSHEPRKATVFTTRPDTLYGATFLVLAPEHDLVEQITTNEQKSAVDEYVKATALKSELERQAGKEKTGVFTGTYAINPINDQKIPVWIADYVLTGYGTGAIMAVPAHDERDFEFARKYDLQVTGVIEPVFGELIGDEVEKDAVIAVVKHWSDDKYLVLNWGPRMDRWGGNLFIGGGIDDGEGPVECAKREIAEETGYVNAVFQKQSEEIFHTYYFSNVKNKNYYAKCRGLLFYLQDDETLPVNLDEGEKNKFTTEWIDASKIESYINDDGHAAVFESLVKGGCYHGEGLMANSGKYDGTFSSDAREAIVADLAKKNVAVEKTNYKMRDWSVSRQRYWGAPIPIVYCEKHGPVLLPDDQLPVVLPELDDFQPSGDGRSALARASDWLKTTCPTCGGPAERETDTLDTYICSSWYMLRYFDPENEDKIFDSQLANKWMPIDFYNGGDHATAHLLYARFVTRFFSKIGLVKNPEPFKTMLFNGKVLAHDGTMFSKSKGNGVDPLEIIDSGYGADALRTYLMFAAPLEFSARWDAQGVPGAYRFINRIWTLVQEYSEMKPVEMPEEYARKILMSAHAMIKKVSEDLEENRYNTAISAAMKCVNELYKLKMQHFGHSEVWDEALSSIVACTAPFAPHAMEELWYDLGHKSTVHKDSWPTHNEAYLVGDMITVVVQVNGKLRANLSIDAHAPQEAVEAAALADENVQKHLDNKKPTKIVYVPGRLVNIVV